MMSSRNYLIAVTSVVFSSLMMCGCQKQKAPAINIAVLDNVVEGWSQATKNSKLISPVDSDRVSDSKHSIHLICLSANSPTLPSLKVLTPEVPGLEFLNGILAECGEEKVASVRSRSSGEFALSGETYNIDDFLTNNKRYIVIQCFK